MRAELSQSDNVCSIGDVPRTDTASRVILAPVTEVYSALVDPEALSAWVLPPGDMTGTIERFDPRPGGSYRMVLKYSDRSESQGKTTSDTDMVEARFVDLVPNARVVYAVDFVSESVCERCGFFETGPQFVTILKRQRKHADQRGQSDRRELFDDLIEGVAEAQ